MILGLNLSSRNCEFRKPVSFSPNSDLPLFDPSFPQTFDQNWNRIRFCGVLILCNRSKIQSIKSLYQFNNLSQISNARQFAIYILNQTSINYKHNEIVSYQKKIWSSQKWTRKQSFRLRLKIHESLVNKNIVIVDRCTAYLLSFRTEIDHIFLIPNNFCLKAFSVQSGKKTIWRREKVFVAAPQFLHRSDHGG